MEDFFKELIGKQRQQLKDKLRPSIAALSAEVVDCVSNGDDLNELLREEFKSIPYVSLLYVIDANGEQVSSNVSETSIDDSFFHQDLSERPYLQNIKPGSDLCLSDVYISLKHQPCITATFPLVYDDLLMGILACDFHLQSLPLLPLPLETNTWRQVKGDPSIRGTLFMQERTESRMDQCIGDVIDIVEDLIVNRGIFHTKIHFSGSRATLWRYDNPLDYRVHVLDEIISPSVCLAYPAVPYNEKATVTADMVPEILKKLVTLRYIDDTIYLRSGSLNVVNGMVGLNFSCDGTHYMKADAFCQKDEDFWIGSSA